MLPQSKTDLTLLILPVLEIFRSKLQWVIIILFSFFYDQSFVKIAFVDIMDVLGSITRLWTCSRQSPVSFIFALNVLRNYFAEVFHRLSSKWRPFSSSYSSCYVVLPVTLFMITTSKQRSPIFYLKRYVLIFFLYFPSFPIITVVSLVY